MKQKFYFFLLLLFILTGCTNQHEHSIYYIPHPDDDILSFGPAILDDLKSNREVSIVLLTQGRASNAITLVNKQLEQEGSPPISVDQFGEARVNEFRKSMHVLGLTDEQLHILDLPDGGLEVDAVVDVIKQFNKDSIVQLHHAFTELDPHPDHAATGLALKQFQHSTKDTLARFYIPIQEQGNIDSSKSNSIKDNETKGIYQKALDAYGVWEPENNLYSIGHLSVPTYFQQASERMTSTWNE
ncbi:PIG-L family deacetylase [Bacillus suaedae]|uniref:PIG-L family deacetylase n=1 Tax=Halalkalibacter suaedae TaxID=2822140 RepID=A0A940WTT0_9BACI|nr:PIG-L family deacetylase [Bacillus suaedae]MBP3950073.1 PIG-L family deacetylase [Bacillus suaedae]